LSLTGSKNSTSYSFTGTIPTLYNNTSKVYKYGLAARAIDRNIYIPVTGWSGSTVYFAETLNRNGDLSNTSCTFYRFATAYGSGSHAEGCATIAYGSNSHAEGYGTVAQSANAHAEGYTTTANGNHSHAEGQGSETDVTYYKYGSYVDESAYMNGRTVQSSSLTLPTGAYGQSSHTEGYYTRAEGTAAHAEGNKTLSENGGHSEGYQTYANNYAHAEGDNTYADGSYSHAEGLNCASAAYSSHAEGMYTYTNGQG